jgi:hypothetical protein
VYVNIQNNATQIQITGIQAGLCQKNLEFLFFCRCLFMCRKSTAITQNGPITAERGVVGFVAPNLLYEILYMAFKRRCQNRA